MVPTLTPAFIIPEGIGGGISGGGQNVALAAAGVVAAGVIVGALAVVSAPVVAALAAKASLLTAASPLGLLAVGSFLKGFQQLQSWGLLNFRPAPVITPLPDGSEVTVSGLDASLKIEFTAQQFTTENFTCIPPIIQGDNVTGTLFARVINVTANRVAFGISDATTRFVCAGSPTASPTTEIVYQARRANNTVASVETAQTGGASVLSNRRLQTWRYRNRKVTNNATGQVFDFTSTAPGTFAPGVRPQLFPQTLPDAPPLPAPPLREPLETPVLPPPPDRRPLAPPVTIPRPGQDPARVPVPGPRPGPSPGPGPSPTPSQPAPAGVPAIGPLPLPIPLPVPTTPGSVVIVDGQPIGGPGQAPAPNLVAIAQELGRLERKAELTLQAGNRGVTSDLLSEIVAREVEALLRSLILGLFDDQPAGSYELQPPCPGPGGGAPAGPDVVEWTSSATPLIDIRKRIDAVAELIQLHKNQGQPTCKTAVSGEEVTIHFESDS